MLCSIWNWRFQWVLSKLWAVSMILNTPRIRLCRPRWLRLLVRQLLAWLLPFHQLVEDSQQQLLYQPAFNRSRKPSRRCRTLRRVVNRRSSLALTERFIGNKQILAILIKKISLFQLFPLNRQCLRVQICRCYCLMLNLFYNLSTSFWSFFDIFISNTIRFKFINIRLYSVKNWKRNHFNEKVYQQYIVSENLKCISFLFTCFSCKETASYLFD